MALKWASSFFPFSEYCLQYETPLARSYFLQSHAASAKLTVMPPRQASGMSAVAALGQRFPDLVPAVIAHDPSLGTILFEDWQGQPIPDDDVGHQAILARYAGLQSDMLTETQLLAGFPQSKLLTLAPALVHLFAPDPSRSSDTIVHGGDILGKSTCDGYRRAFALRMHIIEQAIARSAQMPLTINHGNPQPECFVRLPQQGFAIDSWESADIGPAGMSLHAQFGGCANVFETLRDLNGEPGSEQASSEASRIIAYVDALELRDYASRRDIRAGLPGAVAAGVIERILQCACAYDNRGADRRELRSEIKLHLSDLLDFCDLHAVADRDTAFACAQDYRLHGRLSRSEEILRTYCSMHRDDPAAHALLGAVLRERGKLNIAVSAYRISAKLAPDDAKLHMALGEVLLQSLQFDDATAAFQEARRLGENSREIDLSVARAGELRACHDNALQDEVMPTVSIESDERKAGSWHSARLALALKLFRQYGVLAIQNAFDPQAIQACNTHFIEHYGSHFSDRPQADALKIGNKRYQISITLEGPFNNPEVYANPFILTLMEQLLGDNFALGCTVCATSLPGARNQHLHKDHEALFVRDADNKSVTLPSFGITTMVPLVDLDRQIGTTRVKKGSHLLERDASRELPDQLPLVPVGSCFLMDMRLSHQGLANRSQTIRPILNMVFQRYWFHDAKNFTKHPPLHVPASEYQRIPTQFRRLFNWGTNPGPQINR